MSWSDIKPHVTIKSPPPKKKKKDKQYFKLKRFIHSSVFCKHTEGIHTSDFSEHVFGDYSKKISTDKMDSWRKMKHSFSFCIFFVVLSHHGTKSFEQATAEGDIIIGGLFPIHESVNVTVNYDGSENQICDRCCYSLAMSVKVCIKLGYICI